jgi:hypothetical protein
MLAATTSLEPREVIRGLRTLHAASPAVFRAACKWVPVDLWTSPDLDAMRRGVEHLRERIGPGQRWRMTVEKRSDDGPATGAIIEALAAVVEAKVDLSHPDKILLIEIFADRAALSVLAPGEVFSVTPRPRSAGGPTTVAPPMPPTLGALAESMPGTPRFLVDRVADVVRGSARPFREVVDLVLELLGGVVPDWPLLSEWNRWCLALGASFFVWQPSRTELTDRQRAQALIHTIMMLSAKEQAVHDYRASGLRQAEVAMAGDDCVICDEHRHRIAPLTPAAFGELPPFHPGCRCGFRPHLD